MKALFVAFDFRELHKNLKLNIENMDMSEVAQNSLRPKSACLKF
jgi:hypothetical protein